MTSSQTISLRFREVRWIKFPISAGKDFMQLDRISKNSKRVS